MNVLSRIWLAAGLLGVAALAQTGLIVHMKSGPESSYDVLRKPFSEMVLEYSAGRKENPVAAWEFEKSGLESLILPRLPFKPADIFFRRGMGPDSGAQFECYIVHAENGEDRKHHPEICVRDVQKVPEVESARAIVKLKGDDSRPVQRFCFRRGPGQEVTTYYWHYTFQSLPREDRTWLQTLYQTFSRNPPSVTVQVTTTAGPERWSEIEENLLPAIDRELRSEHLPASVIMGCDRLPIALVAK